MFKILSICMRSRSRPLSPLVDGSVNDVLLQTVPDINKALLIQLSAISCVHTTVIHVLAAA